MRELTTMRRLIRTSGCTIWRSRCWCSPRKSYPSTISSQWTASLSSTWSTGVTRSTTLPPSSRLISENSSRDHSRVGSNSSPIPMNPANANTKCGRQSTCCIDTRNSKKPTRTRVLIKRNARKQWISRVANLTRRWTFVKRRTITWWHYWSLRLSDRSRKKLRVTCAMNTLWLRSLTKSLAVGILLNSTKSSVQSGASESTIACTPCCRRCGVSAYRTKRNTISGSSTSTR